MIGPMLQGFLGVPGLQTIGMEDTIFIYELGTPVSLDFRSSSGSSQVPDHKGSLLRLP